MQTCPDVGEAREAIQSNAAVNPYLSTNPQNLAVENLH